MATEGLVNSVNAIRELSSEIYHQYVPIIDENTDIATLAAPILNNSNVQNEFMSALINRIVYTSFEVKRFRNPLAVLKGDKMPLGYSGQNIFVNRAKGRRFNVEDFAGILAKYEAEVAVEYHAINMDVQYPVTVSRETLKKAFVSWDALDSFISQLSDSLYNAAYIDEYALTKAVVTSAYAAGKAVVKTVTAPTTEAAAKKFVEEARGLFLNFQTPSTDYNAWSKANTDRKITTWTNPEDIVILIRNDIRAYLDVNVLADAFNIDKTTLLGNMISVDNFNVYEDDGTLKTDGSAICGIIADKAFFKIKDQDEFMDSFYNPNNRTTQFYLNKISSYNYSMFANAVVLATTEPNVPVTPAEDGE